MAPAPWLSLLLLIFISTLCVASLVHFYFNWGKASAIFFTAEESTSWMW